MDENILFLGKIIPNDIKEEVMKKSSNTMQDAALTLQWHIIEGIENNFNGILNLCNILPVNSFPKYYEDMFIRKFYFNHKTNQKYFDFNASYCNITMIKQFSKYFCLDKYVKKWIAQIEGEKYIVLYTLDPIFLHIVKMVKQKNPNIKVVCIVADLPNFINLEKNKSWLINMYTKFQTWQINQNIELIDGFILLTNLMAQKLKLKCKYIVMEGIATDFCPVIDLKHEIKRDKFKIVFYAGSLYEKFGILTLVNSFQYIKDDSYRLIICGTGETEDIIKRIANEDKRIIFKGQLQRQDVLKYMKLSTVIVNPRQNKDEFTKYSFPSKNLEALSSGVPLIAYKLDGIPDEYNKYIHYVTGNNSLDLAREIRRVCDSSEEDRRIYGINAQNFVKFKKSANVQGLRILEFLRNL